MNEAIKAAWHDNTVRMQDEPLTLLVQSYRWKRQQNPRFSAMWSHHCAREDVAAGKRRYPSESGPAVSWQVNENPRSSERLAYVESPEKAGLRLVGRVIADCGGRNGIWDKRDDSGWFTDPHGDVFKDGTGLCYGLVYQLPGKDGKSRFVAGYQFGGVEGGPMIDFGTVFEEPAAYYEPIRKEAHGTYGGYWNYQDNPLEMDAARTAARSADSMAKSAAEDEREYQTAWQAGSLYAQTKFEISEHKANIKKWLAERRKAKEANIFGYDSICGLIRSAVTGGLNEISEAREKMRQLATGDYSTKHIYLGFFTGKKRLREAFNDGASEDIL